MAEQVRGEVAEDGEVLRGVAVADAAVILAEGDVEDPVQAVLDPSVAADRLSKVYGIGRQAGADVARLARAGGADAAGGLDADNALEAGPAAVGST